MSSVPGRRSCRSVFFFPIDVLWILWLASRVNFQLPISNAQLPTPNSQAANKRSGGQLESVSMSRALYTLLLLAFVSTSAAERGALVAVGGGGTTDAIIARTLALAGGAKARVVV